MSELQPVSPLSLEPDHAHVVGPVEVADLAVRVPPAPAVVARARRAAEVRVTVVRAEGHAGRVAQRVRGVAVVTSQSQAVVVVFAAEGEAAVGGAPVSAEDVGHADAEGVVAVGGEEVQRLVAQPAVGARPAEPLRVLRPAPREVHLAQNTGPVNKVGKLPSSNINGKITGCNT